MSEPLSFSNSLSLSAEQEFALIRFKQEVSALRVTPEVEELILSQSKQIMIKDNLLKYFMRQSI